MVAKTENTLEHCRPRQLLFPGGLNDARDGWHMRRAISAAKKNPKKNLFADETHGFQRVED